MAYHFIDPATQHAMTGQGEMTIREVARRVDREVKAVHGDVQAVLVDIDGFSPIDDAREGEFWVWKTRWEPGGCAT